MVQMTEIPSLPHPAPSSSSPKPCPLPSPNPTKSFWHSEPDEVLIGHRTTEELPEYVKIMVVGSGITGTSAVRWLSEEAGTGKEGYEGRVLMLEAREACWGATGRNGGHIQPHLYERPKAPDIAEFEQENCAEVASYISKNNIPCEFRQVSGCQSFWTKDLLFDALANVEELQRNTPEIGRSVTVILDKDELKTAGISEKCPGATISEGAASLWPYKYVAWTLKKLIGDGKLNLQTGTAVEKIEPIKSSESADSSAWSEARYKIHTSRGVVTAKHVLLATNAYTSHLLPSFADLIVPVRETMTALLPPESMKTLLPHSYGFVGFDTDPNPNSTEYLIQRPFTGINPKGHFMLGGGRISAASLPSVGEADDSIIDPSVVDHLKTVLPRAVNLGSDAPESLTAEAAWTGIWAASRDTVPWVGQVPGQRGLWLCAAYSGHGMPNATLCARTVVRMMLAEERGEDLASVMDRLVKDREIPGSYLLSEERIRRARETPSVAVQDREGIWVIDTRPVTQRV